MFPELYSLLSFHMVSNHWNPCRALFHAFSPNVETLLCSWICDHFNAKLFENIEVSLGLFFCGYGLSAVMFTDFLRVQLKISSLIIFPLFPKF